MDETKPFAVSWGCHPSSRVPLNAFPCLPSTSSSCRPTTTPTKQPCPSLRRRSSAGRQRVRLLSPPVRALTQAHLFGERPARGRPQGAGRHHSYALQEQDVHHGEDQRHVHFHHDAMCRLLHMRFGHCANVPMRREHRGITVAEVGSYRGKPHEICCETWRKHSSIHRDP